jgi:adenylate cyclase
MKKNLFKNPSKNISAFRLLAGTLFTLCIVLLARNVLFEIPLLSDLELLTVDYRFQQRGIVRDLTIDPDVIICEISDDAIKALPTKFPWPYSYYARAIRNLNRAGATVIAFDVIWDTPVSPEQERDFRELWNEIHKAGNVVLGGRAEVNIGTGKYTIKRTNENYNNIFYDADSIIGIVNIRNDRDGIFRRYQPFTYISDKQVPTFAFAILQTHLGIPHGTPISYTRESFVVGNQSIPNFDGTSVAANYYGPTRTFKYLQFSDIMDDREFKTRDELAMGVDVNTFDDPDFGYIKSGLFKNKIVLIGSSLPEFKDLLPVPILNSTRAGDNLTNGVEVHATVVQNMLDRFYIRNVSPWIELPLFTFLGVLTLLAIYQLTRIKTRFTFFVEIATVLVVLLLIGLTTYISFILFSKSSLLLNVICPAITITANYIGITAYRYIVERRQKAMIKGMFSLYLHPDVVNEIIAHPEKLRLGGEQREMTVLFSDIVNFTTISEKMQPEALVLLLNDFLNLMTEIVKKHRGTLDKYIGDAIVAFWGAPTSQADHALRACKTALDMQRILAQMRAQMAAEKRPELSIRIGLSTGPMVVGNMGGKERFAYTVVGDSVNLGSRLEGANKQYGTYIMISEATYAQVKNDVIVRELDLLVVKGKTAPIRTYELLALAVDGIRNEQHQVVDFFTRGLMLFRNREFDKAIEFFEHALDIDPADHPSRLYVERSRHYIESPPPRDWDGVFVMLTK